MNAILNNVNCWILDQLIPIRCVFLNSGRNELSGGLWLSIGIFICWEQVGFLIKDGLLHRFSVSLVSSWKNILLVLCFVFISLQTSGQLPITKSISIHVSAKVSSSNLVEIITLQHISIMGADWLSGELIISPITDSSAGLMQLNGVPGSTARVSCLLHGELKEESGYGRIDMRYLMSGNSERVQQASRLFETGEVIVHFNDDGVYYLWIGGSVDLSDAFPGIYNGYFTIEIAYI